MWRLWVGVGGRGLLAAPHVARQHYLFYSLFYSWVQEVYILQLHQSDSLTCLAAAAWVFSVVGQCNVCVRCMQGYVIKYS